MSDQSDNEDIIRELSLEVDERDDALLFISELAENLIDSSDLEVIKEGVWMIKQIAEEFQCES